MESIGEFLKIDKDFGGSNPIKDYDGWGSGNGSGSGFAQDGTVCSIEGNGKGNGSGEGCEKKSGYGFGGWSAESITKISGWGISKYPHDCIKSINNHLIYLVNDIPTLIYLIRGNFAKGAVLNEDLTLTDCYIVKQENTFAHGTTLKTAQNSLLEKFLILKTIEQRVKEFKTENSVYELLTYKN